MGIKLALCINQNDNNFIEVVRQIDYMSVRQREVFKLRDVLRKYL